MTDLIQEVKTALQAATPGQWKYNGNEIVSERNERVGIGGFLTEEDNKLAANAPTWIQQLIYRLETAERQREEAVKDIQEAYNALQYESGTGEQPDTDLAELILETTLKCIKGENG